MLGIEIVLDERAGRDQSDLVSEKLGTTTRVAGNSSSIYDTGTQKHFIT